MMMIDACSPSCTCGGENSTDISCGGVPSEFGSFGSCFCDGACVACVELCICTFGCGGAIALCGCGFGCGVGLNAFAIGAKTREMIDELPVAGCRLPVEPVTGNWEPGTGDWEPGTGNRE